MMTKIEYFFSGCNQWKAVSVMDGIVYEVDNNYISAVFL